MGVNRYDQPVKPPARKVFSTGGWRTAVLIIISAMTILLGLALAASVMAGSKYTLVERGIMPPPRPAIQRNATPQQVRAQSNRYTRELFEDSMYKMVPHSAADWLMQFFTLISFATVAGYCFWFHRASANLEFFPVQGVRYSPLWAVLGNVIPWVNVVLPYLVLSEIWKASSSGQGAGWQQAKRSRLIDVWFALKIASFVVGLLGLPLALVLKQAFMPYAMAWCGSTVALAVSTILVVRRVDTRQSTRFAELSAMQSAASPQ